MPDRCLGCIIRCLRLGHVDDTSGHGANEDKTTGRVAPHHVLRSLDGEEVGAVDVDAPKLLDAVVRI